MVTIQLEMVLRLVYTCTHINTFKKTFKILDDDSKEMSASVGSFNFFIFNFFFVLFDRQK